MADHCLSAASYALKAIAAGGGDAAAEHARQLAALPAEVSELVVSAIAARPGQFVPRHNAPQPIV